MITTHNNYLLIYSYLFRNYSLSPINLIRIGEHVDVVHNFVTIGQWLKPRFVLLLRIPIHFPENLCNVSFC